MSYENAPSTIMVATDCACCGRALRDAESVEAGIGPVCREKHGFGASSGPADFTAAAAALSTLPEALAVLEKHASDAHAAANALTHRAAVKLGTSEVPFLAGAIAALGYTTLSAAVAKHHGSIRVWAEGESLVVEAPFSPAFNVAVVKLGGTRWDGDRKVRVVPRRARVGLWLALRAGYAAGTPVVGDKGTSTL